MSNKPAENGANADELDQQFELNSGTEESSSQSEHDADLEAAQEINFVDDILPNWDISRRIEEISKLVHTPNHGTPAASHSPDSARVKSVVSTHLNGNYAQAIAHLHELWAAFQTNKYVSLVSKEEEEATYSELVNEAKRQSITGDDEAYRELFERSNRAGSYIKDLVDTFGEGIIAFIPPSSGVQEMSSKQFTDAVADQQLHYLKQEPTHGIMLKLCKVAEPYIQPILDADDSLGVNPVARGLLADVTKAYELSQNAEMKGE